MKQENPKNSRKKVWLIVAIIAAVVAIGVALAFILPGLLQPQEQGGETLENPEIYFNLDRTQMIDPETTLSTRTPGEDGLYHVRFSVYGEVKEVSVINDKKLINFMDTLDVLCPAFDANGVITDVQNADQYFMVTKDLYVKRMQNGNLEANSSTAMNGMDMKFQMNEASGIYDCQPTAANPGTPSEADWLDKVIAVTDKEKTFAHIYIVDNVAFEGEVAWRAEKSMYDSTKQATKREPDENGVYTIPFFIDGKLVERKSKNKDKVSQIDKLEQFVCVVALEYDEEGYIIDWHSPALALRGFELCKGYTVTAVENGTFSATRLLSGTKQGDMVEATYDDTCKIWNVCRGCNADVPHATKTTELKVGDLVSVYTDLDGKPLEIYVGLRTVDSPMYYNVTRKWSTAEAKSTRVPDEEGYYHIDLAVNGKVKEFKTKNVEHVNYIDSLYYFTCGLKTSGNIIKEVYAGNCVCGYTGAFVNRYVSNLAGAVVSVVLPPDMDAGKNYLTSGKCEIYDVSGESGKPIGQKTTLKKGDRVVGFIDTNSKLTHVYVTQRYNPDMQVAYNMERMYNATTKSTTRVPDAEGYYVYNLALNGTVKQYKTKNKALADFIDLQHRPIVGVKVSGNIIKDACYAYSTILYGAKNFSGHRVKDTKGGTLNTYYFSGTERVDSNLEYKITSKTKIYNVSSIYDKQVGEKTKLKADDLIQAVVDTANKEVTHIYVIERTVKCDLYWPVSRVTGTHINEDGVKVTNRTPNAEGYYVFQMLHNGEQVTLKTKDILVATKVDSLNQAMGLVVEGDIIKQWVPLASTSHFQTLAGNFDITKITKDTIYATRYYASASNYGTEAVIKYNKNTKFICTITSSENYGKLVTPKVGDRITMYGGSSGVATYGFITQENTHRKGMLSYCPHCNKTVFWDKWGSTNIADGMHCYLTATGPTGTTYTFGSATDTKNCDLVLDLNGCTLSGNVLLVDVYDKLTIVDTVGGGKLQGGAGNIRVNPGATLTVLSGTITGGNTTQTGVGGNIYAEDATVNIKGGTISGGVSYLGSNIYHAGTKGSVNISGGKITDGSVYAENSKIINVSGNVEINNLIVKPGNIINVGKLSSGASITVKADGVFTNNGAASYIKNFKVTDAADAIAASGTALAYTNNSGVVVPSKPSVNSPLVLDADGMGMCMVCGETVKWEPIHTGEAIGNMRTEDKFINDPQGTKYHYYFADDDGVTGDRDFLYTWNYSSVCLHLNGKTTHLKGGIYGGNSAVVNIMGEGTLNMLASSTNGVCKTTMFNYYTASLNLYGGTYESNASLITFGNNNTRLKISNDAVINETIDLSQSKLTVEGNAQIQKLNVSGTGKLTVDKNFTGSIVADFETVENGLVKASNGAATGDFAGQIITSEGNVVKHNEGKLAVTAERVTVPSISDDPIGAPGSGTTFDPAGNDGKAFCPACEKEYTWIALNAANPIAGITTENSHFYFSEDYTDTSADRLLSAALTADSATTKVCLNLNGKNVTTNSFIKGELNCATNIFDTAGNGSITYTGTDSLMDFYTSKLTVSGGTFSSTTGNVMKLQRSTWQHIFGNTNLNGKVLLAGGTNKTNLALHDNASVSQLEVDANGKLIITAGWSGTINSVTFANPLQGNKVPADNASAENNNGTIKLNDGRELVKETGSTRLVAVGSISGNNPVPGVFDPENHEGLAYCEICGGDVPQYWTALNAQNPNGGKTMENSHFYFSESFTNEEAGMLLNAAKTSGGAATKVCLNLNGKTVSTNSTINVANNCETFLYDSVGTGSITYTGTAALVDAYTAKLKIHGGTYHSTTGSIIKLQSSTWQHLYGDTNINGKVLLAGGSSVTNLALHDNVVISEIEADAKGRLVIAEAWAGAVNKFVFPGGVDSDNKVPAANGYADEFTGVIKLSDGRNLFKDTESNQLIAVDVSSAEPVVGVFEPWKYDGKAYCPVCGDTQPQTWIAVSDKLGDVTEDAHYYLTRSIAYEGSAADDYFIHTTNGKNVHFNMNGYSITPKEGAAYATGAYLTGSMDLFNTSETESYWSSTCATFGEFVVRNSTTEFVLHDGVTLQATGSNTSQPVVGIYSGTFILNGGTVSAAGKDNNIVIQPRVHGTKSLFVMNSGEVICGTSGTAIRVGEKSAISATTGAVLNGGAITGKAIAQGGYLQLDNAVSPTSVQIASKGKLVVKGTWTGVAPITLSSITLTENKVPAANAEAAGAFTGVLKLADGKVLTKDGASNQLVVSETAIAVFGYFDPWNCDGKAYCDVCGKDAGVKTWVALNAANPVAGITAENTHVYFAEDYTDTSAGRLLSAGKDSNNAATTVCLNLNGKNVTTNSIIKGELTCATNVFDSANTGSITYTGTDNLFDFYTAALKIYGGTFNSTTGNVIKLQKSNWQHLYGNTTINGKVLLAGGSTATNLALHDNASISELEVDAKGKLIISAPWAGTVAKVTFAAELISNKVPAANGYADPFTGTITLADGRTLVKDTGSTQLVAVAQAG